MRWCYFITFLFLSTLIISCSPGNGNKPHLVFLSGAGMKAPVNEIARDYTAKTGVKIETYFEGSAILRDYIINFKTGDVFLPGDQKNIAILEQKGLVVETSFMAWHTVAILVSPEMTGKIHGLEDLGQNGLRLAISNPRLASLGRLVMEKIIARHPMGQAILENVVVYGSSSQDILSIYQKNDIDAIIEWDVMAATPEGKGLTVIPLDEKYAIKDKLIAGLLTTSKHPKEAGLFFQYLKTEGKKIFLKHGYDINESATVTNNSELK